MRDKSGRFGVSVPEKASILSVSRHFDSTRNKEAVLTAFTEVFRTLAPKATIYGIIPGHFKGIIQSGEAVCGISVTREDTIDVTANESWTSLSILDSFHVTVNLLTVIPCDITREDLENALDGFLK